MVQVYATRTELYNYTPEQYKSKVPGEPEATRLLTEASKEILLATRSARYAVDANGYPTDTAIRAAFRDATCAQAVWWLTNPGEETGASDEYDSVSIGSVTLSKGSGGGARASSFPVGATGRLAPKAATELALAGLSPGNVTTYAWPRGWL